MHVKLENLALKTVARQMPEAIVLADKEGRITWVNPAFEELCGYTLSEVRGKHPGRILQGKGTDPQTAKAFRVAVKQGLEIDDDILNYHKDGCSYWARVSITPLRGATGVLQGFIAIERDVTDEHENLEELHGEVVELYSALLYEEQPKGRRIKSDDPFYRKN
ncbi:MAG TPA: PAS domain-containing protein [Opitutales bacterium]|nr:PAS domain-containing protein [Opitutales bacterium]